MGLLVAHITLGRTGDDDPTRDDWTHGSGTVGDRRLQWLEKDRDTSGGSRVLRVVVRGAGARPARTRGVAQALAGALRARAGRRVSGHQQGPARAGAAAGQAAIRPVARRASASICDSRQVPHRRRPPSSLRRRWRLLGTAMSAARSTTSRSAFPTSCPKACADSNNARLPRGDLLHDGRTGSRAGAERHRALPQPELQHVPQGLQPVVGLRHHRGRAVL